MEKLFSVFQLIVAVLLMASILLQQRGATLGSAFGGGSSVYRSRRGVEKWLFVSSIILTIIFISITIALLII